MRFGLNSAAKALDLAMRVKVAAVER